MELNVPADLLYTTDHMWVLVEDDECTIGITDFGQSELSEVVYVEVPDQGAELFQGEAFGTIEAMKAVAELISPISGEVLEMNYTLEDDPRQVNFDAYIDGWIIKARPSDRDEIDGLMTPDEYTEFVLGANDEG